MASREKKLPAGRKQNNALSTSSSPLPPKEEVKPIDAKKNVNIAAMAEETPSTLVRNPLAKANLLSKKPATPRKKKVPAKKPPTLLVKMTPRKKKIPKITQKMIKGFLNSPKSAEAKKKMIKASSNKQTKPRKTKVMVKVEDNAPPVLEPIFPDENNIDTKPLKKTTQKAKRPPKVAKNNKTETIDDSMLLAAMDTEENLVVDQTKTKRVYKRKPKAEITETIEDVMNDLSSLIRNTEVKQEMEVVSESGKSEPVKAKKVTKKGRKENLENTLKNSLGTLGPSERKIIDMLDLNVTKIKKGLPLNKRRHSIEKFPIGALNSNDGTNHVFTSLPRCISPRIKNLPKQKSDGVTRRAHPYKTRSDSPARILRNGKHRKLKDMGLLDGLDLNYRKRKRNYSELSGSEMSTKFSGYESDSSFSDMSSLHGGAENSEAKDTTNIKTECKENYEMEDATTRNSDSIDMRGANENIARLKNEPDGITTDTNSNIYNLKGAATNTSSKIVGAIEDISHVIVVSPSTKVPEKSIILGIMKQTFNDVSEWSGPGSVSSRPEPQQAENTKEPHEAVGAKPQQSNVITNEAALPEKTLSSETVAAESIELTNEIVSSDNTNQEIAAKPDETIIEESKQQNLAPNVTDENDRGPSANDSTSADNHCRSGASPIEETPEDMAIKENILQALGLQSLKAAEEAKMRVKHRERHTASTRNDNIYTGTLKTVIKLNRDRMKKGKGAMKMAVPKHNRTKTEAEAVNNDDKMEQDVPSTSWKQTGQSSDTAGAHRKSHNSNRSNMDGSSEPTSDGETVAGPEGATTTAKALVIPEKASSFSIHPGRICKDECSYCFGKFGLFDTPCHIAQMKSTERQNKVLSVEKQLTVDSCICDACYRHVDRRANAPSYFGKSYKRGPMMAFGPRQDHCHVLGCLNIAPNILKRKWIIKMRRSISDVMNIDFDNPGLLSIPICDDHYSLLQHLMICAMCKRRLAKNHIHYLPDVATLNRALNEEGVPLTIADKAVVCKLCNCFAGAVVEPVEERSEPTVTFVTEYKKRLLQFNSVIPMDEAAAEEPITVPTKENNNKSSEKEQPPRKKRKVNNNKHPAVAVSGEPPTTTTTSITAASAESNTVVPASHQKVSAGETEKPPQQQQQQCRVPLPESAPQSDRESPADYNTVDYNTLIPSIAMECSNSDGDKDKDKDVPVNTNHHKTSVEKLPQKKISSRSTTTTAATDNVKHPHHHHHHQQDVEMSKLARFKHPDNSSEIAVQRLGSNPSISVRQLFPCEEDLPLQGHVDFGNVKEKTPEGWEKCTAVIQYDLETKHLWHELQKPYGNHSSFLRHLILLEKYFRNGDLTLSPNASHHSMNYSESVQNRLRAYDNIPSTACNVQPLSMLPFNRPQKSQSGIVTSNGGGAQNTNFFNGNKELATSAAVTMLPVANAANIPKSTPITISQLNSPPLIPPLTAKIIPPAATSAPVTTTNKSKPIGSPPGLISLLPGTSRPAEPLLGNNNNSNSLNKPPQPQSQKIKFPITKNWRPTLIPIDPAIKKPTEKRAGLVQVISGGQPFHITLEDYRKMCAYKRSFEMKQMKKMQQQQIQQQQQHKRLSRSSPATRPFKVTCTSVLKPILGQPNKNSAASKTSTPVVSAALAMTSSTPTSMFGRVDLPSSPPTTTATTTTAVSQLNSLTRESSEIYDRLTKKSDKIDDRFASKSSNDGNMASSSLAMPKIPKSLTVIPQTVTTRKRSRPSSPVLMITPKPKQQQQQISGFNKTS